jgi:hypothetical protein
MAALDKVNRPLAGKSLFGATAFTTWIEVAPTATAAFKVDLTLFSNDMLNVL